MSYNNGNDHGQDPYYLAQRDFNYGGVGTSFDSQLLEYSRAIDPAATVAPPTSQEFTEIDWEAALRGEKALGLKLTIDEKLLGLLNAPKAAKNNANPNASITIPGLSIRIGSWELNPDVWSFLVVKFNFIRKKMAWEVFNPSNGRKYKLEFNWSDIAKMNINVPRKGAGYLFIKLSKKPSFSKEKNPVPKKRTNWDYCDDFTDEQASNLHTQMLEFEPGVLDKHYHKIKKIPYERSRNNSNTRARRDLVYHQDFNALWPPANILGFDESQRPTLSIDTDDAERDPAIYVTNFGNHYNGGGIISEYPENFDPLAHNQSEALRSDFGHLFDTRDLMLDADQPYRMGYGHFDDQAFFNFYGMELPNQDLSCVTAPHYPSMNPPIADTSRAARALCPTMDPPGMLSIKEETITSNQEIRI